MIPAQDIVERLRSDASGIDDLADDGNFPAHFLERARTYSDNANAGADTIERQARNIEMWKGQVARQSDALSALRADNEALRKERDEAEADEREATIRAESAESRITALDADAVRLREALTPSANTKAAYWGEFYMGITLRAGREEDYRRVQIHWDSIKEIMAAISARAALGDRP